jgi:hypothetical protein
MVGKIMTAKEVHVLIWKFHEYVTLHVQKELWTCKVKDLEMRKLFWIIWMAKDHKDTYK